MFTLIYTVFTLCSKKPKRKTKEKTQIGLLKTLVLDKTRAEVTNPWGVPARAIECAIPDPGDNESMVVP